MLNEIRYGYDPIWSSISLPRAMLFIKYVPFFDIEPWVKCQYNIYDNYCVWAGASFTSFKSFIIHLPRSCIWASMRVCVRSVCVCVWVKRCVFMPVNAPLNIICTKHRCNVSVWPLAYQKYPVDEWMLQHRVCVCVCVCVCVSKSLHGCTSDTRPADKGPFIVSFRRSWSLSWRHWGWRREWRHRRATIVTLFGVSTTTPRFSEERLVAPAPNTENTHTLTHTQKILTQT